MNHSPFHCEHCFFWERWKNPGQEDRGECHARAPYLVDRGNGSTKSKWPSTTAAISCGSLVTRELPHRNIFGLPLPAGVVPVLGELTNV